MHQLSGVRVLLIIILLLLPWTGPWAQVDSISIKEVAPGIYLRPGVQQDASAMNQGHIANLGFIVGKERVAVVDTGGSYLEGVSLRRMIREITPLPISYVIFSHMHPDHVLGAAAFSQDTPVYIGHAQLQDALVRRQSFYLERVRQVLGDNAEGTRVILPSKAVSVDRVMELDLGGRILQLQAYPTAHTNNDLSVYDSETGTLWLADLLFVKRIPVVDGSLLGWLRVMEGLKKRRLERVVPGHGPVPVDWKQALADQQRYLDTLASGIREIIRKGGTIKQAVDQVGKEEISNWLLFDDYHGRNITTGFVELEWE